LINQSSLSKARSIIFSFAYFLIIYPAMFGNKSFLITVPFFAIYTVFIFRI